MNGFHDISLDLLRGEFVKKPQTLSFSYIVYPALLVMIIGVIAAYTSANHQIKADVADLQDQLDRANQNLVAVRSAQEKAAEIQKQLDTATTQLQTLRDEHRQILGNKGDYAPYLNRITSALPAEATFDTINITGNSIRVTGMVNDPFDVVTYFRSLETAGFSGLNIYYIGDPDINNQYPFTMIINLEESSNDNGVE
jgi:Tfp pilus assembly protein PilN